MEYRSGRMTEEYRRWGGGPATMPCRRQAPGSHERTHDARGSGERFADKLRDRRRDGVSILHEVPAAGLTAATALSHPWPAKESNLDPPLQQSSAWRRLLEGGLYR